MTVYYAETGLGACLCKAKTKKQAEQELLELVGTFNEVSKLRVATEDDKIWVATMGGWLPPESEIELAEQHEL